MEDNLKQNGRRPKKNGRRPQQKNAKQPIKKIWNTTSSKILKNQP